jgi:uncharacterized phage protein (predicted DNA packaging)
MIPNVKVTDLDLNTVKQYLRVDHSDDDALISMMITAAQSFIQSYLNKKFDEFEEIPDEFTIACLALISHWYENREIQSTNTKELPYIFSGILDMYRDWNDETPPPSPSDINNII